MDALYGRDFSADNMSETVLNAIDDLFGPINLDTVSQTIHFARFSAVTNQRGRGEFVTLAQLRDRWRGIPTFAIHGKDNGLIDVGTQKLLLEQFGAAGIEMLAKTYLGMGHQDVLIGLRSTEVFADIEAFLEGGVPAGSEASEEAEKLPKLLAVSPWIGPRIVAPQLVGGGAEVACMSRPDQGRATLWLAPAHRRMTAGDTPTFDLLPDGEVPWVPGDKDLSGRWLKAMPNLSGLMARLPATAEGELGWLGVFVYEGDEVTANAIRRPLWQFVETEELAVKWWVKRESPDVIDASFVRLADLSRARGLAPDSAWSRPLRLAVASCQYPSGLFDARPAGASLRRLVNERLDVDLTVLLGDQIYADATAGLLDATRRDELYLLPHERALRMPAVAALMRRLPTQMLPDDHEIFDNWEPLPKSTKGPRAKAERRRLSEARNHGMRAYFRFQRTDSSRHPSGQRADHAFDCGGHAFFMLDSRGGRQRGSPSEPLAAAAIIDAVQFDRLEGWMLHHRDQVKFVCTPSMLLPRRERSALQAQNAIYSDAWCGYPGGLSRLLRFLLNNDLRHTVFLSGDEHHSLYAEVRLGNKALKVVSVHSSALYAPFPFANGDPRQLRLNEKFVLDGLAIEVQSVGAPAGDGFTVLEVQPGAGAPCLLVQFEKADGTSCETISIALD